MFGVIVPFLGDFFLWNRRDNILIFNGTIRRDAMEGASRVPQENFPEEWAANALFVLSKAIREYFSCG